MTDRLEVDRRQIANNLSGPSPQPDVVQAAARVTRFPTSASTML